MLTKKTYTFICDNCGCVFDKLVFERGIIYNLYVTPQECPKCSSFHTMPKDDGFFDRSDYEKIWLEEDEYRNRRKNKCQKQ